MAATPACSIAVLSRARALCGPGAAQVLLSTRVLNRLFVKYSPASAIVMTNLPMPELHKNHVPELYMEQVDALTSNIALCLLVIGQRNADVVTMYS